MNLRDNPELLIPIAAFTPALLAAIIGAALGHYEPAIAITIVATVVAIPVSLARLIVRHDR